MKVNTPLSESLRRVLAALLVCSLAFIASGVVASSAGAVQPQIDIAGSSSGYIAVRVLSNGSVQAKAFGCSSKSCTGSAWTNLGGFVTEIHVVRLDSTYYVVGRAANGTIWYRSATCSNKETCSYSSWIFTGGSGYDIQLATQYGRSFVSIDCPQLAVIGGDRAVWVTKICPQGAGGWGSLGGGVYDIDYTGLALYGVDAYNRLWRQASVDGAFRGNWNNLGGYIRQPVEIQNSNNGYVVAAVGGDSAVWAFSEGVGWQKMANGANVGDMRPRKPGRNGNDVMIIQKDLIPKTCYKKQFSPELVCEQLSAPSGRYTSLAGLGSFYSGKISVGIGILGNPFYFNIYLSEPNTQPL
jgi:hypothetical protein